VTVSAVTPPSGILIFGGEIDPPNPPSADVPGRGFNGHAISSCHILAMKNKAEYDVRNNDLSVIVVQTKRREETIRRNRTRIRKIASALLFCAQQSIATRGHDESET
jgi:hypothetical protein